MGNHKTSCGASWKAPVGHREVTHLQESDQDGQGRERLRQKMQLSPRESEIGQLVETAWENGQGTRIFLISWEEATSRGRGRVKSPNFQVSRKVRKKKKSGKWTDICGFYGKWVLASSLWTEEAVDGAVPTLRRIQCQVRIHTAPPEEGGYLLMHSRGEQSTKDRVHRL